MLGETGVLEQSGEIVLMLRTSAETPESPHSRQRFPVNLYQNLKSSYNKKYREEKVWRLSLTNLQGLGKHLRHF